MQSTYLPLAVFTPGILIKSQRFKKITFRILLRLLIELGIENQLSSNAKTILFVLMYLFACTLYIKLMIDFHTFDFTERFNERVKNWKFLEGPIGYFKYSILEEAIYVCSFLSNFSQLLAE